MNPNPLPKLRKRRKRKALIKDVNCTVRIIVGGKTVKTVKRKLTLNKAVREIGGDPVATEGHLLSRVPKNVHRRIVRSVRVVLMYVWNGKDHKFTETREIAPFDWQAVKSIVRAKIPL